MLQEAGFQVEAAAFERDYHAGRMPGCQVESLGKIAHGKYLQRMVKMLRALPVLRRAIRRNQLAYASGPDMALFALVAGLGLGRPVVLEVGDIRIAQVSHGIKGWLTRLIERRVVNACGLLVVTAPGFIDGYYRKRLHSTTPALVIENKLDESAMSSIEVSSRTPTVSATQAPIRPLRIGYFGVLRCEWSWQVLEALAQSRPDDLSIVVAGYPMDPPDLARRAKKYGNIDFRGQYRSPFDLPALYGSVDIVWACYPSPAVVDPDWRWAQSVCRSNRFYESCFFRRPIITVAESGDAVEVDRYGLGLIVRDQETTAVIRAVSAISPGDLARWQQNMAALPRNVYMYGAETAELQRLLSDLGKRSGPRPA